MGKGRRVNRARISKPRMTQQWSSASPPIGNYELIRRILPVMPSQVGLVLRLIKGGSYMVALFLCVSQTKASDMFYMQNLNCLSEP